MNILFAKPVLKVSAYKKKSDSDMVWHIQILYNIHLKIQIFSTHNPNFKP